MEVRGLERFQPHPNYISMVIFLAADAPGCQYSLGMEAAGGRASVRTRTFEIAQCLERGLSVQL